MQKQIYGDEWDFVRPGPHEHQAGTTMFLDVPGEEMQCPAHLGQVFVFH